MHRNRINFQNIDDGIDWERALPPHIVAQQAAARPPPPPRQHSRTLVFDWPLPEDHPALQQPPPQQRRPPRAAPDGPFSQRAPEPAGSRREMIANRERDLVDVWTGVTRRADRPPRGRTTAMPEVTVQDQRAADQRRLPVSAPDTQRQRQQAVNTQTVLPPVPRSNSRSPPPPAARTQSAEAGWELQDFSYDALLELGSLAVPTGLSKDQLTKMKAQPFTGIECVDCSICLDDVKPGSVCMKLVCQHVFHPQCIVQWLARTNRCPTCRCEIRRKD